MRKSFDVVVLGGGVMGSSTAMWLAKTVPGIRVAVVERDPTYKSASSVLAAGGIRQQFSNRENILLSQESLRYYRQHVFGPSFPFKEFGYLTLSDTATGRQTLVENAEIQQSLGARTVLLDGGPSIQQRFPYVTDDFAARLTAGTFGEADEGWFDPCMLLNHFRTEAKGAGVTYIHGAAVGLKKTDARRVGSVAVKGKAGEDLELVAGHVVNAMGGNAAPLAVDAGWAEHPVAPRKRYVFNVQAQDAEWHVSGKGAVHRRFDAAAQTPLPLLVCPNCVWIRPDTHSFLCGVSPCRDSDPDVADDDLAIQDDSDTLWFETVWPTLAESLSGFESVKLVNRWAGHYEYNKIDQNAIIGAHESCPNVLYINGFSGHGIQQSAAAGRAVCELIAHGSFQTLDLRKMSPNRFASGEFLFEKQVV
ncbi:4-methylaminobutanoate oxidase (formaldehyde-forming) [Diplonema papillatum]|nr:4-methylaminobutanoate oxidase (formaldehyde-forming) [Diplonema papillatum]